MHIPYLQLFFQLRFIPLYLLLLYTLPFLFGDTYTRSKLPNITSILYSAQLAVRDVLYLLYDVVVYSTVHMYVDVPSPPNCHMYESRIMCTRYFYLSIYLFSGTGDKDRDRDLIG